MSFIRTYHSTFLSYDKNKKLLYHGLNKKNFVTINDRSSYFFLIFDDKYLSFDNKFNFYISDFPFPFPILKNNNRSISLVLNSKYMSAKSDNTIDFVDKMMSWEQFKIADNKENPNNDFTLHNMNIEKKISLIQNSLNNLEKLYILQKYNTIKIKVSLDNKERIDCYPILYKDILSYFYIPLFYIDFIQSLIIKNDKFFSLGLLEIFKDMIDKNKTKDNRYIIDCGANIGNHTIFFDKYCNAKGIFCFEPQKIIYDILKINLEINKINAKAYNYIVSSQSDKLYTINDFCNSNFGGTSFIQNNDSINNYISISLDKICKDTQICAIKIDVEGHEFDVLKGALNIISNYHPVLWIEIKNNREEIFNMLSNFNYKLDNQINEDFFFI